MMQQQREAFVTAEEVFQLLGLLVVEGRMPHPSPKGRIEGPHVAKFDCSQYNHVCSRENEICVRAEGYSQQLSRMGQLQLPVTLDVVLLPQCDCSKREESLDTNPNLKRHEDGSKEAGQSDSSVLLERWLFRVSRTRPSENTLSLKLLVQAIRSYLAFSQLSAWYVRSNGLQPSRVLYRVSLEHDDEGRLSASEFEQIAFPSAPLAHTLVATVSLSTLKRLLEPTLAFPRSLNVCTHHQQQALPRGDALSTKQLGALNLCAPAHFDESECERKVQSTPDSSISHCSSSFTTVSTSARRHLLFDKQKKQADNSAAKIDGSQCCICSHDSDNCEHIELHRLPLLDAPAVDNNFQSTTSPNDNFHIRTSNITTTDGNKHAVQAESIEFKHTARIRGGKKSSSRTCVRSPSDCSPAPAVRGPTGRFDSIAQSVRRCVPPASGTVVSLGTSTHASGYAVAQSLVVNFEESLLNGRISPAGTVSGFSVTMSAAGSQFCAPHVSLPVAVEFFQLADDNAPSPYLGRVELGSFGKHGYRVPPHGVLQLTLFNPTGTVVKMFVVSYDLSNMPPSSQTFIRQRTLYVPVNQTGGSTLPSYLRHVVHLRLHTCRRGRLHLHKDVRMIIARDTFEFDPLVARYELRSVVEQPSNPTFSPVN